MPVNITRYVIRDKKGRWISRGDWGPNTYEKFSWATVWESKDEAMKYVGTHALQDAEVFVYTIAPVLITPDAREQALLDGDFDYAEYLRLKAIYEKRDIPLD